MLVCKGGAAQSAAAVHKTSVNLGGLPSPHAPQQQWVCFAEKLKTSRVFLRDVTPVTPNALAIFGGGGAVGQVWLSCAARTPGGVKWYSSIAVSN